jgi:hypothetical protein
MYTRRQDGARPTPSRPTRWRCGCRSSGAPPHLAGTAPPHRIPPRVGQTCAHAFRNKINTTKHIQKHTAGNVQTERVASHEAQLAFGNTFALDPILRHTLESQDLTVCHDTCTVRDPKTPRTRARAGETRAMQGHSAARLAAPVVHVDEVELLCGRNACIVCMHCFRCLLGFVMFVSCVCVLVCLLICLCCAFVCFVL